MKSSIPILNKSGRKPIFFWSDLHIGHNNSLTYDSRPFKNLDEMHTKLINNYNATVPENGVCYFLGDVGLSKTNVVAEVINQMRGVKVCILGNHDKNSTAMYAAGFDVVMNGAVLYISNQRVTLSHCPLKGVWRENTEGMVGSNSFNWHGEQKNSRFTFTDEGQFALHGHIHSPNGGKSQRILGKQFDVGVCANKYCPVSISVIESWIATYGKYKK
jgi:calcineurin-like phosphoesterase family protein